MMMSKGDVGEQTTVLIVDNHPQLRQVMHQILQRVFPDCRIWEATDGAGALQACNAHQPQLVLMDICLPDAKGIELTSQLRSLYPGIRIVVVSHHSADIYVQHALAAGAHAYVCKDDLFNKLVPAAATAIGIAPRTITAPC